MKHSRERHDIVGLILHGIASWRAGNRVIPLKDLEFDDVERIFGSQQKIGWRAFIGCCLPFEWTKVQGYYFKWLGSRQTGRRWVAALIKNIWDVSWDQWVSRNSALHHTPVAEDLSGAVSSDKEISTECELGSIGLPTMVK